VREKEDLSPVKGGDEPLVQAQYRPLSAAIAEAEAMVKKAERDAAAPIIPENIPAPEDDEPEDEPDDDEQALALTDQITKGLQRYVGSYA
jgi:hypothetical protein